MLRTTAARISLIALALCACGALAQHPAEGTLIVLVTDQAGAVIPGAHIVATGQATGTRFEATTGSQGRDVVHVEQGSYDLKVQAAGFNTWEEKPVEVTAETRRTITLLVAHDSCGICVVEGPIIPLGHQPLAAEIPLVPIRSFLLPAKPLRHRPHWF